MEKQVKGRETLNDLSKLNKKGKDRVIYLLNNIVKMVYLSNDSDWRMDSENGYREKVSKYAYELLTKWLGIECEVPYNCYQNLIRLVGIVYGDDEPFSDCGVDKYRLGQEIKELLLWVSIKKSPILN